MNKALYALVTLVSLVSCGSSYEIQGSSNVATLDGQKLYLKIVREDSIHKVDSCDVIHGNFEFSGKVDSVEWANIYMDDQSLLPVVLEQGDIFIKLDNTQQVLGGTPLNDKLFKFLKSFDQLQSQAEDLQRRQMQGIMNGMSEDSAFQMILPESNRLNQKMDQLVTKFVMENYDNVLGPGAFMMCTSMFQYPVFTPWIEDVWSKATPMFKNNPYVKAYYAAAKQNESIMNGTAEMPSMASDHTPPPAPGTVQGSVPALPTPKQMAGDSTKNAE